MARLRSKNNSTGYAGLRVSNHPPYNVGAYIHVGEGGTRQLWLGSYPTIQLALAARKGALIATGQEFK